MRALQLVYVLTLCALTACSNVRGTCTPGKTISCPCPGGGQGIQQCKIQGGGYTPCDCSNPSPTNDAITNGAAQFPKTCENNKKDGQETDLDCGGNCAPCSVGFACQINSDCTTKDCKNGLCAVPKFCNNATKDGDETYIDCGGSCPIKCENTRPCLVDADCESNCCSKTEKLCSTGLDCVAKCQSVFELSTGQFAGVCANGSSECVYGDNQVAICTCSSSSDPMGHTCGADAVCLRGPGCYCVCKPPDGIAHPACQDPKCQLLPEGGTCTSANQCDTNFCLDGVCAACKDNADCGPQDECHNGRCIQHTGCTPNCSGKECGPDGCGGFCGVCPQGTQCNSSGQCVTPPCVPQCGGKVCGDDGCGGVCGTCDDNHQCTVVGKCQCVASCGGKECGDDGCGNVCGKCPPGQTCAEDGQCSQSNNTCGSVDEIGECQNNNTIAVTCKSGKLVAIFCDPSLGLTCAYSAANNQYECIKQNCSPNCLNKNCGPDGCGSLCGKCPPNQACNANGLCVEPAN